MHTFIKSCIVDAVQLYHHFNFNINTCMYYWWICVCTVRVQYKHRETATNYIGNMENKMSEPSRKNYIRMGCEINMLVFVMRKS